MEGLLQWDVSTFEAINTGMANIVFDIIMPFLRNPFTYIPVYVFFATWLVYNFKMKGVYLILFGFLTFALSDQISAHLLKFLVQRPRPCNDTFMAGHVRLLVPCGGGFSFPSTHATNHFAFSFFFIGILPRGFRGMKFLLVLWAATVSFAQVYVGLHFPIDVLFGAALGSFIGLFVAALSKGFRIDLNQLMTVSSEENNEQQTLE
jgi:undecaprenyl-diphosphatase